MVAEVWKCQQCSGYFWHCGQCAMTKRDCVEQGIAVISAEEHDKENHDYAR